MIRPVATEQPQKNALWFYILACLCLLAVCATHPFLRLPYDPWEHLVKIRSIYDTGACFLYWPENPSSFCGWHRTWATLFAWFNIDDALIWASVIHYTQFIFALACVYYFSRSIIGLIARDLPTDLISMAAIWSTLFWLVGNGTYSIDHQQAWIMWYSVTYQGATIPLFWLITAMLLQLLFDEDLTSLTRLVLAVCILAGFSVITVFHPSESVYFFIFFVLSLIFTPLLTLRKKIFSFLFLVFLVPIVLYIADSFYPIPFIRRMNSWPQFLSLIDLVENTGRNIVENAGNRINSSFSELAMVATVAALGYWGYCLVRVRNGTNYILTTLVAACVIFYLIPTNKWLAGITGVMLHQNIVWRFYFGSSWFLFLPLIFLAICSSLRFPKWSVSLLLSLFLAGSVYVSHGYLNNALAGNVQSLIHSFNDSKVGLQYSTEDLQRLERELDDQASDYEKEHILLYIRGDLASLARVLYGYYTYSHRRVFIPMHKFYAERLDRKYQLIPIEIPPDFPKDPQMFSRFNLDTRSISRRVETEITGAGKVVYSLGSTDVGIDYVFITGWAFLNAQKGKPEIQIILESDSNTYIFESSEKFRRDVGKLYDLALDSPGFLATISAREVLPGSYQVGLLVRQNGKQGYVFTSRNLVIPEKHSREK